MFELLRSVLQNIHILQAKINPLQNIVPKLSLRFLEFLQLNEDKGIFICQLLMSGGLTQPVGRQNIRIAIIHIKVKVQDIDDIHRTEIIT